MLPVFRIPVKLQKVSAAQPLTQHPDHAARRFRLGMLVFAAFSLWALARTFAMPKTRAGGAVWSGFRPESSNARRSVSPRLFAICAHRRTQMAKAIIIGMAVSTIGVYSYVQLGVPAKNHVDGAERSHRRAALRLRHRAGRGVRNRLDVSRSRRTGALLVGRPGQHHRATVLAAVWDDIAPALATSYPKTNLLEVFGPQGGLIVTYLLLALAMLAVLAWEKRFFARKAARISPPRRAA